ncbi:hypothetical protein GQ600_11587 [Phytophthora cactorum]|nr:hypothetical protein GQ600_11587 [Phytophthora cactorum]
MRMTEQVKYTVAPSTFSRISTELSDLPDDKCKAAIDILENWRSYLQRGDVTMELPEMSENADEEMHPTQVDVQATAFDEEGKDGNVHVSITRDDTAHTQPKTQVSTKKKVNVRPFNPRTRVGRSRKDRAVEAAQRSSKLKGALRVDDVVDVAEFIKSCEPPPSDLASFLSTFEVRHLKYQHKQLAAAWRVPEATIIPYRLPEGLIPEGLQMIQCKTSPGEVIDLSTPVDATSECWALTVDGIGDFSQRQLMGIQYVSSLVHTSVQGMKCYSWLMNIVDDQISHDETAILAK